MDISLVWPHTFLQVPKFLVSKHISYFLSVIFFRKSLKKLLIYLILSLTRLGLCCCMQASSRRGRAAWCEGCLLQRLLCGRTQTLGTWASVTVAQGLSCSAACGIFPDRGSNPCPPAPAVDP